LRREQKLAPSRWRFHCDGVSQALALEGSHPAAAHPAPSLVPPPPPPPPPGFNKTQQKGGEKKSEGAIDLPARPRPR